MTSLSMLPAQQYNPIHTKIQAKKKFGQNFLHNTAIQARFAEAARSVMTNIPDITSIIEVGPGMGAITQHIVQLGLPVTAYEIDPEAVYYLSKQTFAKTVTVQEEDFLQTLEGGIDSQDYIFVSNLPFNVGSRILVELALQQYVPPLVVVLQKEVIEKITKRKDFTLFGGWLALYWSFSKVCDIAPGNFVPAPKVTSTLVSAIPLADLPALKTRQQLLFLLKQLVRFPSKTIANNLKGMIPSEDIQDFLVSIHLPANARLGWDNYEILLGALVARS
jgi:16S rRNA (adenine1518-N6/adenine1519-N6)-dimethyltransferase